jgi:hypothetical protein
MSRVASWVVFGVPALLVWACNGGIDRPPQDGAPGGNGGKPAKSSASGRGGSTGGGDQSASYAGATPASFGGAQASAGASPGGAGADGGVGGALGAGGYADAENGCDITCPHFDDVRGTYELEMSCYAESDWTWKSSCGGDTLRQTSEGVTRTYHFDANHKLVGVVVELEELGTDSQTYGKSCTRVGPIKELCGVEGACRQPLSSVDIPPFNPKTTPHHDAETFNVLSNNDCGGVNHHVQQHDSSSLISYDADNNAVGAFYLTFSPRVCDDGSVGLGTVLGELCESRPGTPPGAGGTGAGGADGNGGAH